MMNKKCVWIIASTMFFLLCFICIGPLDVFSHGFYSNEIDVEQIADEDKIGQIKVNDEKSVISFSPQNSHFAGVELYLVNHYPENGGIMTMLIFDDKERLIDEVEIELNNVPNSGWYKVYTRKSLKENNRYTARFTVVETETVPEFMLVNHDYLLDESLEGNNILINYAYAKSTFSFQEKILLSMLMISIFGAELYLLIPDNRYRNWLKVTILFLGLTTGMAWNFMYNSFGDQNAGFHNFQGDSEILVSGPIYAKRDGIEFLKESEKGYGLGKYYNLKGIWNESDYMTDDNWLYGYSRTIPAIVVNSNVVTKNISVVGNYIKFGNGEECQIIEVSDDGSNLIIKLDADRNLTQARNGSLDNTIFYDMNHLPIAKSYISAYESQYGLHGKIFGYIAKYMDKDEALSNLNLICAVTTAMVFTIIALLLGIKINPLFGSVFYITFALSPWVVNFARNLYWVEFTWFLPMVVGLICSLKIDRQKWRIGCYIATFISIVGKCLCGYEYISVIMMGLVAFLVIDLLLSIVERDTEKTKLLFRTTLVLGIVALTGFIVAICIHALLKGRGDIIQGIKMIIRDDVLRRTNGANLNNFNSVYWPSMNASVWEVYRKYFHFQTDIIVGIKGDLFPLLCIIPGGIFVYEIYKGKIDFQGIFMYIFFFFTSISWFCLAKSHSYIHTHMNYVLWYFGFVQVCIYIIMSRIVGMISTKPDVEFNP